jgi:hypothetical protein
MSKYHSFKSKLSLKFLSFLIILTAFSFLELQGQCTYNGQQERAGALTPGCAAASTTVGSGAFQRFSITSGVWYSFNTCGSTYDTQMGGYNSSGTYVGPYNDDDGSGNNACGGTLQSGVDWQATYTGELRMQVNTYNCVNWPGGGSATLTYRITPPVLGTPSVTSVNFCDASGNFGTAVTANSTAFGTVEWQWGSNNGAWNNWVTGTSSGNCCFPKKTSNSDGNADRIRYRVNNGGCVSAWTAAIPITNRYNEDPSSLSISNTSYCSSSAPATITLTANFPSNVNMNGTVEFFSGSCGGTLVASVAPGATSSTVAATITAPSSTTSYYAHYNPGTGTGCLVSTCVNNTVTVNAPPTAPTAISSSAGNTFCSGVSTTLSFSGGTDGDGATYQWYAGGCGSGSVLGTGATLIVSPTSTTTYYVRRVGNTSCTNTTSCASLTITVHTPPTAPTTITSSAGNTICNGTSTTLSFSGGTDGDGATYEWFAGGCGSGSVLGTGATLLVSPTSNTTYYVRRIGNTSCTNTTSCASQTITVENPPTAPTAISSSAGNTFCSGVSTTLSFSGGTDGDGATYQWYAGGCGSGSVLGTGATLLVSPTSTTTYYVRRVGNTSCTNTTTCASQTITVDPLPTASAGGTDGVCPGDAATVSGASSSGGTILWTHNGSGSLTNATTLTPTYTSVSGDAGNTVTLTMTITSTNSCSPATATASYTVDVFGSSSNVVLVNGSSVNATEECVDGTWTYYSSPSAPGDFVFAINKNGNSFTAEVDIVDLGGNSTYSTMGGAGPDRGTFLIGRHWNVTITSGSVVSPVDVRYFVDPNEVQQAFNEATALLGSTIFANNMTALTFFKTSGGAFDPSMMGGGNFSFTPAQTWTFGSANPGSVAAASGTLNGVSYYELTGVTSFSGGTGGFSVNDNPGSSLPVELLSWEAKAVDNNYIELSWSTATEINNDGFEILRSTNGVDFEAITWVAGNGNSTEQVDYLFKDTQVSSGVVYYYKLKQVDFNGESETFDIVSAKIGGDREISISNLVPNPSKDNVKVQAEIISFSNETLDVVIYNHVGVKVAQTKTNLFEGTNLIDISVDNLSSGTYFVNFEGSFGRETKKLVIVK